MATSWVDLSPDDGSPATGPAGDLQVSLMPQEGFVFVDIVGDRQQVTCTRSLRRQWVPGTGATKYEIMFDDDGFGALTSCDDEAEVLLLENVLSRQVYQSPNTREKMVRELKPDGSYRWWSLLQKQQEVSENTVGIRNTTDLTAADETFKIFFLAWPRARCHFAWPLGTLYKKMQMTSYGRQASKWCYGSWPQWTLRMRELGFQDCLLKSFQPTPAADVMNSETHIVPEASVLTVGLLHFLLRWANCTVHNGGLRGADQRALAAGFLQRLLQGSCWFPWVLELHLCSAWTAKWPRPDMVGPGDPLRLQVDSGGMVDLAAWKSAVEEAVDPTQPGHDTKAKWYTCIKLAAAKPDGPTSIALWELLLLPGLAGKAQYGGCMRQVVWQAANHIEQMLRRSEMDSDDPMDGWPLRLLPVDVDEGGWSEREVDMTCAKHIAAIKYAMKNQVQHIGFACDKVQARGLCLFNAFVVLPDNTAFEMVPQVFAFYLK